MYVNNLQVVIALTVVQDLSFSGLINDHLSKLNIFPAGSLELKPNSVLANKQRRPKLSGKMTSGLQKTYIVTCNAYRHLSPSR
jgi:hypothetical protein